jgi:multiple antibiotic resistance protein
MQVLSALGGFSTFPTGLLLGFPALFSITDPIGNSVIFSQLTSELSHRERVAMARRVGFFALVVLLASLWAGSYVLSVFGITLPALKVGGGLVVVATGWQLLYGREETDQGDPDAPPEAKPRVADMAFFPITMPLVVGPGAISVAITLGAARPNAGFDAAYLLGVSLAAGAVALAIWLLFTFSDVIGRTLGKAGSHAVKRVVSLLLLTIGVQIVALGVQDMLISFLATAPGTAH